MLWPFRCISPDMTQLYQRARDSDGFVMFGSTGHSNFAVTHPGMFRYLPTDIGKQKQTTQFGATAAFVVNTRSNFDEVLWWYYLCALTEDCIAPSRIDIATSAGTVMAGTPIAIASTSRTFVTLSCENMLAVAKKAVSCCFTY